MNWKIQKINELIAYRKSGVKGDLVRREDVIAIFSKRCRDCKHYNHGTQEHPITGRPHIYSWCESPKYMYKGGHRMTAASADACARFEEKGEENGI